jgi:hypothetical protein
VRADDTFRKDGANVMAKLTDGAGRLQISEAHGEKSHEEREDPGQPPQDQKADNEQRYCC